MSEPRKPASYASQLIACCTIASAISSCSVINESKDARDASRFMDYMCVGVVFVCAAYDFGDSYMRQRIKPRQQPIAK